MCDYATTVMARPTFRARVRWRAIVTASGFVMQVEAFARFFVGSFNVDMTYDDDLVSVAKKNVCSASGFWFDCITSIPWSYMDLVFYVVIPPFVPITHSPTVTDRDTVSHSVEDRNPRVVPT